MNTSTPPLAVAPQPGLKSSVLAPTVDSFLPPLGPAGFGGWLPVKLLGVGNWTVVYQARPATQSPTVESADYVIKFAHPDAEPKLSEPLLGREMLVGQEVRHANLIVVLAASDVPVPHIIMPYVAGVSLAEALRLDVAPALPQALWIIRQVAMALAAMHRNGWLHGDVKPANVMVSPNGHATLIDLAFSRRLNSSECGTDAPFHGSLPYSAPELFVSTLCRSELSDVYSLGVCSYELLAGNHPLNASDGCEWAQAHLRQVPVDLRDHCPQLPAELAQLVQQMLSKEPLRRPLCTELIDRLVRLEALSLGQRVRRKPLTVRRRVARATQPLLNAN